MYVCCESTRARAHTTLRVRTWQYMRVGDAALVRQAKVESETGLCGYLLQLLCERMGLCLRGGVGVTMHVFGDPCIVYRVICLHRWSPP